MSSSPSGTLPATSSELKPASSKPDVNQTTCFAGPPTLRRAMILITFVGRTSDMSCGIAATTVGLHFVGARFSNEVRGAQQALKRSGVSPPAFDLFPGHRIAGDVSVVDVCDFELAATGRLQSSDDVEDFTIVHVNADDCVLRLRLCGLLVDANDATAIQSRDAETLRIGNFFQDDLGAATLRAIIVNGRENVSLDDVVTQDHTHRTIGGEVLDE